MTTPDAIHAALSAWSSGDRQAFKEFFATHPDLLETYDGPGDVFDFLLPALFVREFCHDLLDAGFPVHRLFAEDLQDFAWTAWPRALEHVATHAPQLLIDLASDQDLDPSATASLGSLSPSHQAQMLVQLPGSLAARVQQEAQAFQAEDDHALAQRREAIAAAANSPRARHAASLPA